ncbi:ABC transporter permease, partial [Clostridium saccharobutylicum]
NIICIAFLLVLLYLVPPYHMEVDKTKGVMMSLIPMLMIIYFSHVLTNDFENKTYKTIFTGGITRVQVLISKYITLLAISILLCFIYKIFLCIAQVIEIGSFNLDLKSSIPIFILYATSIGSFAMLIMSVTLNFKFTFMITFVLFNDFVSNFINIIAKELKVGVIQRIVENVPFKLATNGFQMQSYSTNEIYAILVSSIIFFSVASFIIAKRDLR